MIHNQWIISSSVEFIVANIVILGWVDDGGHFKFWVFICTYHGIMSSLKWFEVFILSQTFIFFTSVSNFLFLKFIISWHYWEYKLIISNFIIIISWWDILKKENLNIIMINWKCWPFLATWFEKAISWAYLFGGPQTPSTLIMRKS